MTDFSKGGSSGLLDRRPGRKSIFSLSLLSFPFVISRILLARIYSESTTETEKSVTRGVWLPAWTEGCIILS